MTKLIAKLTERTMFSTINGPKWFEAGTLIKVREDSFSHGLCTASVYGVPDSVNRIPVARVDPDA